jgi:hypothetical protein
MCDDQAHGSSDEEGGAAKGRSRKGDEGGATRRRFLKGAAVGAAGLAAGGLGLAELLPRKPLWSPARPVGPDGSRAYSMAMHIHSSFSEQSASMQSQLFQAAKNSVDVLWWTDHDSRMVGLGYRRVVHFTSLSSEKGAPGQGAAWRWVKTENGPLTGKSHGGIVQYPCSPNDPVVGGSLHLAAESRTTATATYGFYADSHRSGLNYRDNLTGQSLTIDVLLKSGWTRGYLELLIHSSYHEAAGGRPAGDYGLSYRFVPPGIPARRVAHGTQGAVVIPVKPARGTNPWSTITITPSDDIAALWPDLDYRDFALWELTLGAVSDGELVSGYFDYLRFTRRKSGEVFLQQQMDMAAAVAPRYPSVAQRQGLEVSAHLPHINWFGGAVVIPDYSADTVHTWNRWSTYLERTAVPQIHAAGGLVSYNHPFGYGAQPEIPLAQQDRALPRVARTLLATGKRPAAFGADLLEVGYPLRNGVNLAHHVALWDTMSRNGVFLTGNGTSDDHYGQNWLGIINNWVTSAWAASTAEADLLASLAAGRAWCGSLSGYRGSLDLLVDGSCPMGSVSVSRVSSRQLEATATRIPAGGSLQVLQGTVDHAGPADPAANTRVIASYGAGDVGGGSVATSIDTSQHSFVRTQVLDRGGSVIALSNPVWLLRSTPPRGIPAARAV